jgi:hypothetical protein
MKGTDGPWAGDFASAICGSPGLYAHATAGAAPARGFAARALAPAWIRPAGRAVTALLPLMLRPPRSPVPRPHLNPPPGEDNWWANNGGAQWKGGRAPTASINFVTAHDGFTLADLVAYNEKHNEAGRAWRGRGGKGPLGAMPPGFEPSRPGPQGAHRNAPPPPARPPPQRPLPAGPANSPPPQTPPSNPPFQANGENNQDGESHNLSWNCGEEGPTSSPDVNRCGARTGPGLAGPGRG